MHIFLHPKENACNFLKFSIDFFGANFISLMLVENNCNLIIAKMFLTYTIFTEKCLQRLTFQFVVLDVYIFYFIAFLILEDKIQYFFIILRSKSMFYQHYFLSQVENIGSIKRYFHRLLCFSFNNFVFKRFPCAELSFEVCFWISSKEKCEQISKSNLIISAYRIEVLAWKMMMNVRSTTCGLML